MLREVWHFVRYAPRVVRMSFGKTQAEMLEELVRVGDEAGFARYRASLVEDLRGEILEIGCGTGAMLPYYAAGTRVVGTEPDSRFLSLAESKIDDAPCELSLQVADAMDLPFESDRFDAVVVPLVLCSVPSVPRVLSELLRVLKPGGLLRSIEHVLSDRPVSACLMHVFNPAWRLWNRQGCNMNRRVERPMRDAGFELLEVQPFQVFVPGLPSFPTQLIRGRKV